jgi:ABC-type transport system involved in cytochrome c biogenesis permease subunit
VSVLLQLLNILLPLGYLLAVLDYLVLYTSRPQWSVKSATTVARSVAAVHGVYLILSAIAFEHVPVANVWESFTFVAFAITAVYLVLEWWLEDQATGVFLLAPALFFQVVSSAFLTQTREVDPILQSSWFGIHVTAALIGYAACAVAAVYGLLYMLLYRSLKGTNVGLIFHRLPNLEVLGRLNVSAMSFGWVCLALAILVGTVWARGLVVRGELEGSLLSDPKFSTTVVVWVLYSLCLGGHYLLKWPGRRLAWISVVAFLLMVASSILLNVYVESFHSFG